MDDVDFDVKPGRRDGKPKGGTFRNPRDGRGPREGTTIEVVVPRDYEGDDVREDIRGYHSLNHHRLWELVDELKKEGKNVVEITTERYAEKHVAEPMSNQVRKGKNGVKKMEEAESPAVRQSRSGPVPVKNESKSSQRRRQQHEMNVALSQAAGPLYIVRTDIPESQRKHHFQTCRDGIPDPTCPCCRGYVEEKSRGQKNKELLDL